ncbi:MAG: leucine-rich repeat domain-containing protein [Bacteroidales bacterium]
MKKRFLFLLLIIQLAQPLTILADTITINYITYETNDTDMTASITGYTGDKEINELVLPNTVSWLGSEYTITSIASYSYMSNGVFYKCTNLTSVTLPDGLTEIGGCAFYECSSLKSIDLPDGLTEIGNYAFSFCLSLTSIYLPRGLTMIGNYAFYYCSKLATVQFNVFVAIGIEAFYNCPGVTTSTIEGDGYIFQAVNNMATITGYQSTPFGEYTIPSTITVNNTEYYVTSIYKEVFQDCTYITSLILPEYLRYIDNKAFYGCSSLTSINLSESITAIGNYAFRYCSKLTDIKVNWKTPLTVTSSYVFTTYSSAILSVPVGTLEAYKADSFWGQFYNIIEDNSLVVEKIEEDDIINIYTANGTVIISGAEDGIAVKVYDLNGTNVANGVVFGGAAQVE